MGLNTRICFRPQDSADATLQQLMYVGWNASGSFYWVFNHTEYKVNKLTTTPYTLVGRVLVQSKKFFRRKKWGVPNYGS